MLCNEELHDLSRVVKSEHDSGWAVYCRPSVTRCSSELDLCMLPHLCVIGAVPHHLD
jgi:hypothetical protein